MATVTPNINRVEDERAQFVGWDVAWAGLANGDVGAPVSFAGFADRSFQVTGTFGAGGSVACEGSNNGAANYFALTDPSQTVIAITAAGGKTVTEATIQTRPHVTAGDGTTALTVTMFFRRLAFP
jgi:hypothetical protein